jgi:CheY-like chemotaxis protein
MSNVLLVENDSTTRRLWRQGLTRLGYGVTECGSVAAAQDIIRNRLDDFDVAVIDLRLNDDDREAGDDSGYQLARADIRGRIPVVLITASEDVVPLVAAAQLRDGAPIIPMLKRDLVDGAHRLIQQLVPRRVFVAFGHDPDAKNAVEDCLKLLGLRPVVLASEPSKSDTIIEMLERLSDVSFAVILLTPDDEGKSKSEKGLRQRARQNVVLEWGYFVGKLGRNKVAVLCKNDGPPLDLPSNSGGVLWKEMDPDGKWRERLADELNAAGIHVDAKRVAHT